MLHVPFVVTPLLNERNMGVWHTNERSRVHVLCPDEALRLKTAGYYHYAAPQGESCLAVVERLEIFLEQLGGYKDAGCVLISGHGISGLCFRQVLFSESFEQWKDYKRLVNASVTVYERHHTSWTISLYNYVPWEGHLDAELVSDVTS
jgi:broad specificity phosphatase PhoE